jgi:hypothetical protein
LTAVALAIRIRPRESNKKIGRNQNDAIRRVNDDASPGYEEGRMPVCHGGTPEHFRHQDFHQVQARERENAPLQSSALELNSSPAF